MKARFFSIGIVSLLLGIIFIGVFGIFNTFIRRVEATSIIVDCNGEGKKVSDVMEQNAIEIVHNRIKTKV